MAKKKAEAKKTINTKPLVFTSPESSNVEGGSYVDDTAVIAFRDKKNPEAVVVYYSYNKVDAEDFKALMNAPSKGKHMREVFRKKYQGVKLG